jgi:hypothetical protein
LSLYAKTDLQIQITCLETRTAVFDFGAGNTVSRFAIVRKGQAVSQSPEARAGNPVSQSGETRAGKAVSRSAIVRKGKAVSQSPEGG